VWLQDGVSGPEYLLILAVPRPKQGDVDAPRIDFTGLAQKPIEGQRGGGGGDEDPSALSRMLDAMAFGKSQTRGEQDKGVDPTGLCARLIAYRNHWGHLALPPGLPGEETKESTRRAQAPTRAATDGPPSPWFVGTHIAAAPEEDGVAPAVVTWSDGVTHIYIDADGDAGIAETSSKELAKRIADGTLDVELVVRLSSSGKMAWYGLARGKDPFSLVRQEPATPDGTVVEYKRDAAGSWNKQVRSVSWLNTATLGLQEYAAREAVIRRLHAFRKR
jgi:hypothetical protein